MRQDLMFKLDQNPEGPGLRCDDSGLFLGRDALLRKDRDGHFDALSPAQLQKIFARIYGDETNWESRIRSVELVADALNKGEMARAMMSAVLMRLPAPGDSICIAEVDELLAKVGYDADEPRDDRGRWTDGVDDRSTDARLADAGVSDVSNDPVAEAAERTGRAHRTNGSLRAAREPTAADVAGFGPSHYEEAQQLAAKLGHGATAQEFLALSSVETMWGTSVAAQQAANFFGVHNREGGPFPGQTGTYVTSGMQDTPGQIEGGWLPPNKPSDPVQNLAVFSPQTGYRDSGAVVVAALLRPKALRESGGDYSDPAVFFATVHNNGWAEGVQSDYVRTMLQRIRHFGS
jgi:hypothetical protein